MAKQRYRYRAYPTTEQQRSAAQLFGCVRVAWNDALAACHRVRTEGGKKPSYLDLSRALTVSKQSSERAFLTEVSSIPLQQSVRDLDRAYQNFFKSLQGKRKGPRMGAPRFKKRSSRQAARFTRGVFSVRETTHGVGFVTLSKLGEVRYQSSRPLPSNPSSVTLIRESDGRYYVSFVVDVEHEGLPETEVVAGIDLGLTDLAIVVRSNGEREKVANPRWLRSKEQKLARAQRALSRKTKGSANYNKARQRVATEHRKVRETRLDHHHKLALRLIHENQVVAVEGLSVAGLARTRMAKSIQDAGWATLLRLLHEKAEAHGRQVIVVDRWAPTTRTCSVCGGVGAKKGLDVRVWTCSECGSWLDRDYNAAVNVMVAAGLAETLNACGGSIRHTLACADPMNQEPTEQSLVA